MSVMNYVSSECVCVCAGGRRDTLVCRGKAAPQCAGADRAASATAGTESTPHNGADNVIFRREPGFLFRSPGFSAFREEFMKHSQEEYWRPRFHAPPLRSHPDPPPTIQCSWYPHEGQCPYMRLALVCWRSNGECTFTDMQKIEKRGEKRV